MNLKPKHRSLLIRRYPQQESWKTSKQTLINLKQECIPVGCVPPAAVAVWGVCLSACWDTPPWVWAWRPSLGVVLYMTLLGVGLEAPWVWAWRPLWPDPSTSPWVWAWRPPSQTPQPAPLGVGLENCNACWDTTHPPVDRMTDTCKNITFANFVCGR